LSCKFPYSYPFPFPFPTQSPKRKWRFFGHVDVDGNECRSVRRGKVRQRRRWKSGRRELSVRLLSYPDVREGDRPGEALGTEARAGGSASVRAATQVKPEQAPKVVMRAPSRCFGGEGRWDRSEQPTSEDRSTRRGSGRSTHAHVGAQHGRPAEARGQPRNRAEMDGRRQESEGLVVPLMPVKAGGGKGPWFGVRPRREKGRGVA
jgi:hypothetical protein